MGTVADSFKTKALKFCALHIKANPGEEGKLAHWLELHRARVNAVEMSQVPSLAPKVADALLSMWNPSTKPPLFLAPDVVGWLPTQLPPYWDPAGGPLDSEGRHLYQMNDSLEGPRIIANIEKTPKGPVY